MLIIWCLEGPVAVVHYFMSIVFIMDQLTANSRELSFIVWLDWILPNHYQISSDVYSVNLGIKSDIEWLEGIWYSSDITNNFSQKKAKILLHFYMVVVASCMSRSIFLKIQLIKGTHRRRASVCLEVIWLRKTFGSFPSFQLLKKLRSSSSNKLRAKLEILISTM